MIIIINSNIITNKIVCQIEQSVAFLLWQFIEAVLITSFAIVFVFFVDVISITITILSYLVTEASATIFKYLEFSQIHVLGFQL